MYYINSITIIVNITIIISSCSSRSSSSSSSSSSSMHRIAIISSSTINGIAAGLLDAGEAVFQVGLNLIYYTTLLHYTIL